jgi:hypothetical protein
MDWLLPSSFEHCLHTISLPCFASDPISSHRWLGGARQFLSPLSLPVPLICMGECEVKSWLGTRLLTPCDE